MNFRDPLSPVPVEEFSDSGKRLDNALDRIDRQQFISSEFPDLIAGHSIPTRDTLRRMLSVIDFPPEAHILQLGAGSGYVPAVLSLLGASVTAVEQQSTLVSLAGSTLAQMGIQSVRLHKADGSEGLAEEAPFDVIVISTPSIAGRSDILKQLGQRAQLVCIESLYPPLLTLVKYTEHNGRYLRSEHGYIDFRRSDDEILINTGILTPELLEKARSASKANQTKLIDEIHKLKNLDDAGIYRSLARQYDLTLGEAHSLLQRAQPELFGEFSRAFLDRQQLIPLYREGNTLVIASSDPKASLSELQQVMPQQTLKKILVTPTDFRRLWSALEICLQTRQSPGDLSVAEPAIVEKDLLSNEELPAHLVVVFEALLLEAIAERASDIHLEVYEQHVRIRLRIDGDLHDLTHFELNPQELRGLINIIKIRTEMNIAEKRLPQGGRSRLRAGDALFDLRVQVQPSLHGEHAVIRILPQHAEAISIEQLGLPPLVAQGYRRVLQNPSGLVLVSGPTGSGKTTTLYAGLQLLAADSVRKVITVEDPIEYSIDNIQQTRIRPEIDFHFADAMRSFVRQDPDVIMVGEIRDHETALEAIRASQTGHVVLSTIHANDAVDVMQRLYNLDVDSNALASELTAIIAQRLAPRLCEHCKMPAEPDPVILREVFPRGVPEHFIAYRGAGCEHCKHKGSHGRVAVVEYLKVNDEIRDAIARNTPIGQLRALALDCGLITMRDSALEHIVNGVIAFEELPRLLPSDRMAPEIRSLSGATL